MIKFFRHIRQTLIMENKTSKYLKYAIGEIVLVVIGILIALQVNNWNEQKQSEEKTSLLIEQVYSTIKRDNEVMASNIIDYNSQLKYCETVLNHPDSLSNQQLVELLFYLDTTPNDDFEADKFATEINYEAIDKKQINLVAQIKNFLVGNSYKKAMVREEVKKKYIQPYLENSGLPQVISIFGFSTYFNFNQQDGLFTNEELEQIRDLLNTGKLVNPIKSIKERINNRIQLSVNIIEDGKYLLGQMEKTFPGIHLVYENVGIIGTALPSGYTTSVPMELTDEMNSIWEIEVKLENGAVKFRTRNSWTQNWGGTTFPEGYAQYYGRDIPVPEAGWYHITLNLKTNQYEFKKIDK